MAAPAMHPIVESRRAELAAACVRRGVRKLELFGSAARSDFDEARSDIDLLVEFNEGSLRAAPWAFFDLKDELEDLLGRSVDWVSIGAIRNPYVRATIEQDRLPLYET